MRFFIALSLAACAAPSPAPGPLPSSAGDCEVVSVAPAGEQQNMRLTSYDGAHVLLNARDDDGIFQVFVGAPGDEELACITCDVVEGAPPPAAHKLMAVWHPGSAWIFLGAPMDGAEFPTSLVCDQACVEGLLLSGVNLDMWAVRVDGSEWTRLRKYDAKNTREGSGYTGPAFDGDGRAFFAEITDGNIFVYGFGKWRLMQAGVAFDDDGVPSLTDVVDVTPAGANWVEPGNFAPDGETLLLSTDIGYETNATFGQDQWTLNVATGEVAQLTATADVWDEHGLFSPDGRKVAFMSSLPYRTTSTWVGNLKTEFLLMDADGSNVVQLTHFNEPGFDESLEHAIAAVAYWSDDGTRLWTSALVEDPSTLSNWEITFAGPCGRSTTE